MKRGICILLSSLCFASLLGIAGCAPRSMTEEELNASQSETVPEFTLTWSSSSDCSTCHVQEQETMTAGIAISGAHNDKNVTCSDCHSDEVTLTAVHKDMSQDTEKLASLKGLKTSVVSCTSNGCHDMSDEEFIGLTADCTLLTDTRGTTVNPHTAPTLTATHVETDMKCDNCHRGHTDRSAEDYCITCHHDAVYECGTCHV